MSASPVDRVKAFLSEMLEWEIWYMKAYRECWTHRSQYIREGRKTEEQIVAEWDEYNKRSRDWLQKIIAEYLTQKAAQKHGEYELTGMSVSKPPAHLQEIDQFEQKTKLATVITKGSSFIYYRKYILRVEDDKWKIDSIYSKSEYPDDHTWRITHGM